AQPTPRNYANRGHHKQYAPLTHSKPQKNRVPTTVLTQSKPEEMDLETAQNTTTAKFSILKQENGNSFIPIAQTITNDDGTSTTLIPGPIAIEEKVQKKNDVKERSMLLMALPNEHLMTFNQYKDAKTLFAAIQTRFGGNEATKKTLLKQMYENFSALSTESLDSIFNRLQKIIISIIEHEEKKVFLKKTCRKITINGSDTAGYDKSNVECFNCHKLGHFAGECRQPRNQDRKNKNQDSSRRTVNMEETASKAMAAIDGAGLFSPPKLDLSNSGLEELQQPEFEGYRFKISNSVSEDISNKFKESPDALLVKELVPDDKLEKKTIFPTVAKI
nr:ribonuclease H-like domain-containing protein [Tanacetum cinerariifolium]